MRRTAREDFAPSEIMDTSVSITLRQRDDAIKTVYRFGKDEEDILTLLSILGLDSDELIVKPAV